MQKVPTTNDTTRKCTSSKLHTFLTGFLVLYIVTTNFSFGTDDYQDYNSNSASTSSSSSLVASTATTTQKKMVMLTTAAIVQNETLSDQGREDDEKAEDDDDTTTADEEDRLVHSQQQQPPPRLGDGCYHVFIDVGANIGVHGRFLYEPEKYPESWSAVQLFEQEYGTNRTNEDYCVFAIEANPSHWPRLETVAAAYRQYEHGWSYTVIPAGASDQNGTMTFYKQGGHDDRVNNEWGFFQRARLSQSNGQSEERVDNYRARDTFK